MPGLQIDIEMVTTRNITEGVINAISVDVEDWLQSAFDSKLPLTDRFNVNTRKILEAFEARGVKGTFFVLGLAAKQAPEMVREIYDAGHEVQSHGYGHELVTTISPEHFKNDIERSKKLLEDIIGVEITGYRAPAFTITQKTLWALDTLLDLGFKYDSSIFPVLMKRYGIDGAPWYPYLAKTPKGREILELPVGSFQAAGRRWATGGGGYFRLLPYSILRRAVRQLNEQNHSATIYMHPYEYDPIEFAELDYPIPMKTRLHQGLGRRGFPGKVNRLLTDFRFGTMQDVIDTLGELETHEHRGLDD